MSDSSRLLTQIQEQEQGDQRSSDDIFWPFGTMPNLPAYLKKVSPALGFVDMLLRGAAQVCFMNNPVTGALVIIALMINDWFTASFGLLSLVSSTLTGLALKGYDACIGGLFGFNGILVGIATSMFFEVEYMRSPWHIAIVAILCILFGVMSSVVAIAVGKCLDVHGLPGLTLPFIICTIWILAGSNSYSYWTMGAGLKARLAVHGNITTCLREKPEGACDENQLMSFVIASLRGVCEIYLANNTISAVLMLTAFAICSPLASALLWAGSAIGVLVGWLVGLDGASLYIGLFGFNPALVAAGVGAGIFGQSTLWTVIWGIFGAIATPFLQGTLLSFFLPAGVPAFTLPFCIATLFLLGAGVVPKPAEEDEVEEEE